MDFTLYYSKNALAWYYFLAFLGLALASVITWGQFAIAFVVGIILYTIATYVAQKKAKAAAEETAVINSTTK